jgi:hypothetical protein
MHRNEQEGWGLRGRLVIAALLGLAVFIVLTVIAAGKPSDEAGAWFAAIAAGVGVVGIGAAVAAVYVAIPGYRELLERQRERPNMTVVIEIADVEDSERYDPVEHDGERTIPRAFFYARVHVRNEGNGVLRFGIVNVQVPAVCSLEAKDPPEKRHYVSASMGFSGELSPDQVTLCRFSVAERDFPPQHDFLYHVYVVPPEGGGTWPIAAVVDGYPGGRTWARVRVTTR